MRHFIGYHNAESMGYSSATLTEPRIKTKNKVNGLNGVTVWLIAGEGKSPKQYYIASNFIADSCDTNMYP